MTRSSLLVSVLFLLAAFPRPLQEEPSYRGIYVTGFETSGFLPCAERYTGEQWWVSADSVDWETLQRGSEETPPRPGEVRRSFVRVRGTVTDNGSYGHLGAFHRELHVSAVLTVLPRDAAPCGPDP